MLTPAKLTAHVVENVSCFEDTGLPAHVPEAY
jgi:hypothetical protein